MRSTSALPDTILLHTTRYTEARDAVDRPSDSRFDVSPTDAETFDVLVDRDHLSAARQILGDPTSPARTVANAVASDVAVRGSGGEGSLPPPGAAPPPTTGGPSR